MSDCDTDSESILGFTELDLAGVDFDASDSSHNAADQFALRLEQRTVDHQSSVESTIDNANDSIPNDVESAVEMSKFLAEGKYVDILRSGTAMAVFGGKSSDNISNLNFLSLVQKSLASYCTNINKCVEMEMIGIAAFNLFQQLNYTGPTFDLLGKASDINPHPCFHKILRVSVGDGIDSKWTEKRNTSFQNAVLSELSCDGLWPCQIVEAPYFLLLARCIFLTLSDAHNHGWMGHSQKKLNSFPNAALANIVVRLNWVSLWSARAAVAHERLLLTQEPTSLWKEVENCFIECVSIVSGKSKHLQAMVFLEFGLACYHFNRTKEGKLFFGKAKEMSGLYVEITGAKGKRTKFQQTATAQLLVRAVSRNNDNEDKRNIMKEKKQEQLQSQMIDFKEDDILHERVQFEDKDKNVVHALTILDQAILLALCLDIKNNNPADGLTGEEMSAYLARVLCHQDDWMVYSTSLLERSWLEFEGNHTKERSILQMQALVDQHTDRLTITQSTRESIDTSSPVQERLKNLHMIVYPPRWQLLQDIAQRYAQIGIVTSAAEIFTEIEAWDDVVECYRRAGRKRRAEEIVRERLSFHETPRMWNALGDITNNPVHYEKAIDISQGRFSQAYVSLGRFYEEAGNLRKSVNMYREALRLRPLVPPIWFRVGTLSMQLQDWDGALVAFTEVVQQHPEEAEAWANVAAIHMHNKHPEKAYPALNESLKYNRNSWRIWVSKLYTCLDLQKFDEATQASNMLLDLKIAQPSQNLPNLEEKCVKAIVGGTVEAYMEAMTKGDTVVADTKRRSLDRVQQLLDRMLSSTDESWIYEARAFLLSQIGLDEEAFDNLMKMYRSLTSMPSWEKNSQQVGHVCRIVKQIVEYQQGNRTELVKSKFLVSNTIKKISESQINKGSFAEAITTLKILLDKIRLKLEEL